MQKQDSKKKTRLFGAWQKRAKRKVKLHKSFKRSYREDYIRNTKLPGLLAHAFSSFKQVFKYWRVFLKLILFAMLLNVLLVGLMNEELYVKFQETIDQTDMELAGGKIGNFAKAGLLLISTVTTGGLNQVPSEAQQIFGIMIFLIVWLTTIYLMRFLMAKKQINLRDALYNSLSPLLANLVVFLVMFVQAVPLLITMIAYSAAQATDFLATPFYALVFFVFAVSMILLSLYSLSGSFLALVAVTTPGIYPGVALVAVGDLIAGRRIKLIVRLLFLLFILGLVWVVVGLPVVLLDMWLKANVEFLTGVPIVSVVLLMLTVFSMVYAAVYFYLLYRKLIDYDQKK